MYEKGLLMLMTAHSPLHPGAGSGLGAIDLPVQRERFTNWPIVHAGGLKGALRDYCARPNTGRPVAEIEELFGPESNPDHAGALGFSEANVLLFPVRSLKGVFGYVTCPLALTRFQRDLQALKAVELTTVDDAKLSKLGTIGSQLNNKVKVPKVPASSLVTNNKVLFEEMGFDAQSTDELNDLALWLAGAVPGALQLKERLALVDDEIFTDFVQYSTEVMTRNRIDDATHTVAKGALWNEEHLPRETVLYAPIFCSNSLKEKATLKSVNEVVTSLKGFMGESGYFWLGGDTTVGRGLVQFNLLGKEA